jgi:hypothetical protein
MTAPLEAQVHPEARREQVPNDACSFSRDGAERRVYFARAAEQNVGRPLGRSVRLANGLFHQSEVASAFGTLVVAA